MKFRRITAIVLAVMLMIPVFSLASSALVLAETQYNYDKADPSWLKDLVVMEQLNINDAAGGRLNKICADAEYEYTETAQTFKETVSYYYLLYKLDADARKAAYLYILDYLNLFSSAANGNVSDDYIRYWLESAGIVYPENETALTPVLARALYALLTSSDSKYTIEKGTGLESALMAYAAKTFGVDINTLRKYSQTEILTLDQYVTAACRYTLYLKGYKVNKDTDEKEVARLMAVYVIESQGIAVDPNHITFEELQTKYTTAMLGKIYDVTPDPDMMKQAVDSNSVASYILQLIGKKYNLTVRSSLSYDEMFALVRDNTDYFKLEDSEFYADIDKYKVKLDYKRDKIWVMPTAITDTNIISGCVVEIFINGQQVKDNYFTKIALDSSKTSETITVRVDYYKSGEAKKTSNYYIEVYQGTETPPQNENPIAGIISSSSDRIKKIKDSLGDDSVFSDIFQNINFNLPQRVLSIMSLLVPSFTNGLGNGYQYIKKIFGFADDKNSGTITTDNISGVGGLESYLQSGSSGVSIPVSTQLITNNLTSGSPQVNYVGVDKYVVEPATGNISYTDTGNDKTFSFGDENSVLAVSLFIMAAAIIAVGIALAVKFNGKRSSGPHGKSRRKVRR